MQYRNVELIFEAGLSKMLKTSIKEGSIQKEKKKNICIFQKYFFGLFDSNPSKRNYYTV